MGIQISGPFSSFYNKTGPLIGRRYKGKNVITGLHYPSNKLFTSQQLLAQRRFSVMIDFLNVLKPLIDVGFKAYARRCTALNAAFAYNNEKLLSFDGFNYKINYPVLVYSRGNVAGPNCPTVQMKAGKVVFSWLPEAQSVYNLLNDRAIFLICNEDKEICMVQMGVVERSALSYEFELPVDFSGDTLHCYMNFDAASGKMVGNNVYVGWVIFG